MVKTILKFNIWYWYKRYYEIDLYIRQGWDNKRSLKLTVWKLKGINKYQYVSSWWRHYTLYKYKEVTKCI